MVNDWRKSCIILLWCTHPMSLPSRVLCICEAFEWEPSRLFRLTRCHFWREKDKNESTYNTRQVMTSSQESFGWSCKCFSKYHFSFCSQCECTSHKISRSINASITTAHYCLHIYRCSKWFHFNHGHVCLLGLYVMLVGCQAFKGYPQTSFRLLLSCTSSVDRNNVFIVSSPKRWSFVCYWECWYMWLARVSRYYFSLLVIYFS